ncbi:alpha/beta hydrolase [Candidatus Dojkabacteria bacterium]|uniref:Alpha/beta hydrolase n=1 Tax=Candidatus Dojkabacteria bacterium TaxID=2099670 RepID=A0A955I7H4_9BACT|nr:alpha/beta hydrolase [Candidatus Dojkabacteria bacterium]
MKNAILLHGTCSEQEYLDSQSPPLSANHWFPWLQKKLLISGIHARTPQMPDAQKPDYLKWKTEFEMNMDEDVKILIGHSCGGGFLTRWLSENTRSFETVVLVAPWLDPDRVKTTDFFDFEIDKNLPSRIKNFSLFISKDDDIDILDSAEIIKTSLPSITLYEFENRGHFTIEDLKRNDFPELLEVIIREVV